MTRERASTTVRIHPTVHRRWLRWYPWLRVRSRAVSDPQRDEEARSIILGATWRRAEAERVVLNAARIYANATRMRGFQVSVGDLTRTQWIDKVALRRLPRRRERRRMVKILAVLGVLLACILAIPARYAWCEAHGGHLQGGSSVNSQGRLGGSPSCVGAK